MGSQAISRQAHAAIARANTAPPPAGSSSNIEAFEKHLKAIDSAGTKPSATFFEQVFAKKRRAGRLGSSGKRSTRLGSPDTDKPKLG